MLSYRTRIKISKFFSNRLYNLLLLRLRDYPEKMKYHLNCTFNIMSIRIVNIGRLFIYTFFYI